jgi:hypothetical protein
MRGRVPRACWLAKASRPTHQRIHAPSTVGASVVSASLAVNHGVRVAVQAAISTARLPSVVAGSCDAAIGVVVGLGRGRCGIVWAEFGHPCHPLEPGQATGRHRRCAGAAGWPGRRGLPAHRQRRVRSTRDSMAADRGRNHRDLYSRPRPTGSDLARRPAHHRALRRLRRIGLRSLPTCAQLPVNDLEKRPGCGRITATSVNAFPGLGLVRLVTMGLVSRSQRRGRAEASCRCGHPRAVHLHYLKRARLRYLRSIELPALPQAVVAVVLAVWAGARYLRDQGSETRVEVSSSRPDRSTPLGATGEASPLTARGAPRKAARAGADLFNGWTTVCSAAGPAPGRHRCRAGIHPDLVPARAAAAYRPLIWGHPAACLRSRQGSCSRLRPP